MAGVTKTITQIQKPQLTKSPSQTSKSERSRSGFNKIMVEYRPIYSHYFAIQLYDMLNATFSYTNELVILRDELHKCGNLVYIIFIISLVLVLWFDLISVTISRTFLIILYLYMISHVLILVGFFIVHVVIEFCQLIFYVK